MSYQMCSGCDAGDDAATLGQSGLARQVRRIAARAGYALPQRGPGPVGTSGAARGMGRAAQRILTNIAQGGGAAAGQLVSGVPVTGQAGAYLRRVIGSPPLLPPMPLPGGGGGGGGEGPYGGGAMGPSLLPAWLSPPVLAGGALLLVMLMRGGRRRR